MLENGFSSKNLSSNGLKALDAQSGRFLSSTLTSKEQVSLRP